MHTFVIVGQSKEGRVSAREKILKKFGIDTPQQIIILEEKNKSIETVRHVQKLIQFRLKENQYKALVIAYFEQFSLPAQAALLKTLEEPPEKTIIIIEAQNSDQILPTILSRSQLILVPETLSINIEEEKKLIHFWSQILLKSKKPGEKLLSAAALIQEIGNREEFIVWLDKQIIFFRNLLLERVGEKQRKNILKPGDILKILKALIFSKKHTLSNVNIKLLADHLFISLPIKEKVPEIS